MSIWSSILGGIAGVAGNIGSSLLSYSTAKKLQQNQYDLNKKAQLEYFSNMRKSATDAGYNPLYALGTSGQGFSANSSGVSSDISGAMAQGVNSALSAQKNNADIKNVKADTELKNQQSKTEESKRVQMQFQNAMTDVETHLKQKDLSSYERRLYTELYERMQHAENLRANSAVAKMNADTNRLNAETNRQNSAISAQKVRNDYYVGLENAKSNRINTRTNRENAKTNRINSRNSARRYSVKFGPLGISGTFK